MISNRLNNNPKIKKKHFINNSKKYITPSNKKTLIENIPKLNLHDILKKSKFNNKIRNNKIIIDKSLFYSSDNNNQNITYNDFENEDKKFDTDNNLSINCHNNISINLILITAQLKNLKIFFLILIILLIKNI